VKEIPNKIVYILQHAFADPKVSRHVYFSQNTISDKLTLIRHPVPPIEETAGAGRTCEGHVWRFPLVVSYSHRSLERLCRNPRERADVMLSPSAKLRINSAKHLAFFRCYEDEILRLSPQDDIAGRVPKGKG
jgi:hypothetical protein